MKYRNWSIGERLGVGLGLVLLTLAALVAVVFTWHAESARVQQTFTERIAPLAERAQELERALLYVAIDLRSYLLAPGPSQLQEYREAIDAARQALARLREYPKGVNGERLFGALETQVQRYLTEADALVGTDPSAASRAAAAEKLGMVRETAAASAREFAGLQDEKASSVLAAMAQARKRVSDGIIVGSIVARLFCFALAYFTAQSIRRPTRDLLKLAAGLTSGDLGPALAWNAEVAKPTDATPRNEMVHLAQAFGAAAAALQRRERRLEAHHNVATALAANLEKDKAADGVLRAIVEHLGAEVGVIYWNEAGRLVPIATHALPRGTSIA
ncbi:MAG: hypothetical protein IT508_11420, partial [Burkholderiaceae bacterium]|nr:hypothetical protein [Burkholderiaceae bacterium]